MIEDLFADAVPIMRAFLESAEAFRDDLFRIGPDMPPEPRWNQDWFPRLDALAAYVTIRKQAPRHILEVGAGHSTRFMARALRDGEISCGFISVDPQPRAVLDGLAEHTLLRKPMQDVDVFLFSALGAGDVLFVDSSHVHAPGSDVDVIIERVVPLLPAGVLVHFHDIFLPGGYPAAWANRRYNEQDAVAALLQSGEWEIRFSSAYSVRHLPEEIGQSIAGDLPFVPGAIESSLWLRKV